MLEASAGKRPRSAITLPVPQSKNQALGLAAFRRIVLGLPVLPRG